jgi:hypothetical protein
MYKCSTVFGCYLNPQSHIILFKLQQEALISLFQNCSFFIALGTTCCDTDKEDHILDEEIPLFV